VPTSSEQALVDHQGIKTPELIRIKRDTTHTVIKVKCIIYAAQGAAQKLLWETMIILNIFHELLMCNKPAAPRGQYPHIPVKRGNFDNGGNIDNNI
jgi:hypothetical protein